LITAVDTNILVDVLVPDQRFGAGSTALLEDAFSAGPILVCDVVYAELAAYFTDMTGLENFLAERAIRVEALSRDALFDVKEVSLALCAALAAAPHVLSVVKRLRRANTWSPTSSSAHTR
jgi:predicted nucleic acid-binding protein